MSKSSKKLVVPTLTPRNPFVAAAKMRRAGSHQPSRKAERQRDARALRQQLQKLKTPVDDGGFVMQMVKMIQMQQF